MPRYREITDITPSAAASIGFQQAGTGLLRDTMGAQRRLFERGLGLRRQQIEKFEAETAKRKARQPISDLATIGLTMASMGLGAPAALAPTIGAIGGTALSGGYRPTKLATGIGALGAGIEDWRQTSGPLRQTFTQSFNPIT